MTNLRDYANKVCKVRNKTFLEIYIEDYCKGLLSDKEAIAYIGNCFCKRAK